MLLILLLSLTTNFGIAKKSSHGTFVTIGDSITARDRQTYGNGNTPNIGYQPYIKKVLNFDNYINLGVSGSTITRGTPYLRGLTKIAGDFYFGNAEFIIVQAGTNDFALDTPLGDRGELNKKEPDRYNFYGAYSGLVKDLKRNNRNAEIYLWTPTIRDCKDFNKNCTNKENHSLKDYRDAIIDIAKFHNVHLVDMYSAFGPKDLYKYTYDGLHLNNDGYQLVAKKFLHEYIKIHPDYKNR